MSSAILDSSILIDCLRGREAAVRHVGSQALLATPVMAATEILVGDRNREEQDRMESFLGLCEIISPSEADALAALDLLKKRRLSHGVDWPDCQIAATALRPELAVHTLNVKHFATFERLSMLRAY